jgi:tRNA(Ile)-lysidine synthase
LLDIVRNTIRRWGMLSPGDAVGVAVSGGADSVCLLHVLRQLAPEYGITLHVLHLNHGWRGAESDADADFVAALAGRLGIPITAERAGTAADPNAEQAGRDARLGFFERMRETHSLTRIATGHTRSDQAETVLYRLLRGSGTAGLSGIRPVTSDGRIRPLLACSRQEVEAWLRENGGEWRDDATNGDTAFLRNRLRHTLIPLITRDFQPAVSEILAATAELAQDEETWWAGEVERLLPDIVEKKTLTAVVVRADKLSSLDPAPARRVVRRLLADVRGDLRGLDLIHVDRVRQLAAQKEGHGRTQLPGVDVFRSFEWLRIGPLARESRFALDYAFQFRCEELAQNDKPFVIPHTSLSMLMQIQPETTVVPWQPYNEEAAELDADLVRGVLELRNWHPGDEMKLPSRTSVKLKQLFQEFRIPLWERHLWPVLTCGETVVWSRRFGPSEEHQRRGETRRVLHVAVRELRIA